MRQAQERARAEGIDVMTDMVVDAAQAGAQYNKLSCLIPAISLADAGYALLDFGKGAIIAVAVDGTIAVVIGGITFCCPAAAPYVAVGCKALRYYIVYKLFRFAFDQADICVEAARTSKTKEEYEERMKETDKENRALIKELLSAYNVGQFCGGMWATNQVNQWFAARMNLHQQNVQKNGLHNEDTVIDKSKNVKTYDSPDPHPSTPVGIKGKTEPNVLTLPKAATINGIKYTDHAILDMQKRGILPSFVEQALRSKIITPDPIPNRFRYYDPINHLTVIWDSKLKIIISTMWGKR